MVFLIRNLEEDDWKGSFINMLDFSYYAPTYYEFGRKSEEHVGELIQRFDGHKVLIHYGGGSVQKSGLLDRIKTYLSESNIPFLELGGVQPNPESDLVYNGIELCRKEKVDFILAVGGGSVIDSAKAIGAGVLYDGDFWDFFKDDDCKVVENTLPVGVVLTIAAAGSEGSPSMVITNSEMKLKRGNIKCDAVRPVFAIMNPELTFSLPEYQTACGIVDIMTHVIERYFSNTKGGSVTDRMCESILKAMIENGKKVMKDPNNYEARANIMWASTIAHNNICGVGRVQDWSSHKIEHELSAKYGIAHGAGLAVVVIKWMRFVSTLNPSKFIDFSKNVFGVCLDENDQYLVEIGILKLQEFWKSLGMPITIEELGYKSDDLEYLVEHVDYAEDGTLGNYVKLTPDDVRDIYRS